MAAPRIPPGTRLASRYDVVQELGAGGMGVVYEVEHVVTKHRRALKVLSGDRVHDPTMVARFLQEATAAAKIGNAHVVDTFDGGELPSGGPYIVMELLVGETVEQRLRTRGRFADLALLAAVMEGVCDGVHAVHEAGILHRDLKPENIFLVGDPTLPFAKIMDFGISKFDARVAEGQSLTADGTLLGTPYYMAPEQLRGVDTLDRRIDVYALGVILYECAAGVRPYEASAIGQLALDICGGTALPLGVLRDRTPVAFEALVSRAMHVSRDERFATARDLGDALAAFRIQMLSAEPGATITSVAVTPETRLAFRPPSLPDIHGVSESQPPSVVAETVAIRGTLPSLRDLTMQVQQPTLEAAAPPVEPPGMVARRWPVVLGVVAVSVLVAVAVGMRHPPRDEAVVATPAAPSSSVAPVAAPPSAVVEVTPAVSAPPPAPVVAVPRPLVAAPRPSSTRSRAADVGLIEKP